MKETIKTWKCKECGKEISSMYEAQFAYNVEAHKLIHKKEVKSDADFHNQRKEQQADK